MQMYSLKCPNCEGTLQVDENHMLTKCPFCGNANMIIEDKEVTLKRLDNRKKELEIEEYKEKHKIDPTEEKLEKIGSIIGFIILIVFGIGSIISFFFLIFTAFH